MSTSSGNVCRYPVVLKELLKRKKTKVTVHKSGIQLLLCMEMRESNFKGFHIIVAWTRILVVFPVWLLNLVPKAN